MHPAHMNWYMKEEQKKEERMKERRIEDVNRRFSRIIAQLAHQVDQSSYHKEEQQYNRQLVSSSIWQLRYQNNFINPNVMSLQASWIVKVLEREKGNLNNEGSLKRDTASLIHRMAHVDRIAYSNLIQSCPGVQKLQ